MSEKYFLGAMTQNGFSTEFGKIMADKEYSHSYSKEVQAQENLHL